jgi:hypothetical protein
VRAPSRAGTRATVGGEWRLTLREAGLLLILWLTFMVPWLGRPVHLDDTGYLLTARWFNDPDESVYFGDLIFFGSRQPRYANTHPILLPAFQGLLTRLSPAPSEALLHLGQGGFTLLALLGAFLLGRRLAGRPWLLVLLLLGSPAFLVMSHSLMTEIPTLGLWWLGMACFLMGGEQRRPAMSIAGGLLLAGAVLTSYYAFGATLLLALDTLVRRPRDRTSWGALALPCLALALWTAYMWRELGQPHFLYLFTKEWHRPHSRWEFQAALLSFLAGAGPLPWLLYALVLLRRGARGILILLALAGAIVIVPAAGGDGYRWSGTLHLGVNIAVGLAVLLILAQEVLRLPPAMLRRRWRPDDLLLAAWLCGTLFYNELFSYVAARNLIGVLPPLFIMLARLPAVSFRGARGGRGRMSGRPVAEGGAVVLSLCLAVLVAQADAGYARFYKRFALSVPRLYADEPGGIWFNSEFGFRHYMELQGYPYLHREIDRLPLGEIVLRPRYNGYALQELVSPRLFPRLHLERSHYYAPRLPIRVFTPPAHAGFYCHFSGLLPWSISRAPAEIIDQYRVVADVRFHPSDAPIPLDARAFRFDGVALIGATADLFTRRRPTLQVALRWLVEDPPRSPWRLIYELDHPYAQQRIRQEIDWEDAQRGETWLAELEREVLPADIPGEREIAVSIQAQRDAGADWETVATIPFTVRPIFPPVFAPTDLPLRLLRELPGPLSGTALRGTLSPRTKVVLSLQSSGRTASELIFVSRLGYGADLAQGSPVVRGILTLRNGSERSFVLAAGVHTAEWTAVNPPGSIAVAHGPAPVAWRWEEPAQGSQPPLLGATYLARVPIDPPGVPARLTLENVTSRSVIIFEGLATR